MANPALFPVPQFFNNAGAPLAGGLVYGWEPGTSTPKDLYKDAALSLPHARPIVLDGYGVPPAPIWCSGETFINWTDAAGVALNIDYDNFNQTASGAGAYATKNAGVLTKSANYALTAADDGKTVVATSGTWTLSTAAAAATLGDGYFVDFINAGTGLVTFDPTGSEVVDSGAGGVTTLVIAPQTSLRLNCDGGQWYAEFPKERAVDNRIINGTMAIDQRNAGAGVTVNSTTKTFAVDRWWGRANGGGAFAMQRVADAPLGVDGLRYCLAATVTVADGAVAAGDYYHIAQDIEGLNVDDLAFGKASNAQFVTVSFWFKCTLTGPFCGTILNGAANRSYSFSFPYTSAGVWQEVHAQVPVDTGGTWLTDTGIGATLMISLGQGNSFEASAGLWNTAGGAFGIAAATELIGTNAAVMSITGVRLVKGGAPGRVVTRVFAQEFPLCARYYQRYVSGEAAERRSAPAPYAYGYATAVADIWYAIAYLATPMRATPTATRVGTWTLANVSAQPTLTPQNILSMLMTLTATAGGFVSAFPGTATGYTLDAEL